MRLIIVEYEPLLFRGFDSTGDMVSHPLESLSTGKTQQPLCQVGCKQSSPPNTRRTMNHNIVPCLCIGNRLLNCLFQIGIGWNPKIRDGQIQHLEARFEVQRSQIAPGLVETFFITREEDNNRNLFLRKRNKNSDQVNVMRFRLR